MAEQKTDFRSSLRPRRVRFQFTYGGLQQIPPFPPTQSSTAAPTTKMGFPLRVGEEGIKPCQIPSDAIGTAPKNAIFYPERTGSTSTAEQRATDHPPPRTGKDPTFQEIPRSTHRHTTIVAAPHTPVPLLQSPHLSSLAHPTPLYQQEFKGSITSESMSTPQIVFSSFCNERASSSLGSAAATPGSNAFMSPGKQEPSLASHAVKRQYLDISSGGLENRLPISTPSTIAAPAVAGTGAVEVDDADQAAERQEKKRIRNSLSAFTVSSPPETCDSLLLRLPERFWVDKIGLSLEGREASNIHVDRTPSPIQSKAERNDAVEAAVVTAAVTASLHEIPRVNKISLSPEGREASNICVVDRTPSQIQPKAERSDAVEAAAVAAAFTTSLHEAPWLARMGEKELLASPMIIKTSLSPEGREASNIQVVDRTPSQIQPKAERSDAVEAAAVAAAFTASLHEIPWLARTREKEFLTSPVIVKSSRPE